MSRLLSGLPGSQFNELITAILPPPGVVSPPSASQGNRVYELLQWLGSPTGEDYFNDFLETLEIIAPGKFQPSPPTPTSETQAPQPEPIPQPRPAQATTSTPASEPEPTSKDFQVDLGGGVTLDMVYIPGGRFWMGSPESELERLESEGPRHQVSIPSFYMGKYAVTQHQWRTVCQLAFDVDIHLDKPDPSYFKGDELPVEKVTWNEAVEFCKRLSKRTGNTYRLPSEAEWEYACRAETLTPFFFGQEITTSRVNYGGADPKGLKSKRELVERMAREDFQSGVVSTEFIVQARGRLCSGSLSEEFTSQSRDELLNELKNTQAGTTTKVGSFPPNKFGLYDMHGNVREWCQDVWHDSYAGLFRTAPTNGRAWLEGGSQKLRVVRGGSWDSNPRDCRSASRFNADASERFNVIGFRVCFRP